MHPAHRLTRTPRGMHMQAKPSAGPRPAATHKPPSCPAPARATRSVAWPAPRRPLTLHGHARASQIQRQRPIPALPQPKLAQRDHAHAITPTQPARAERAHAVPAPAPWCPACAPTYISPHYSCKVGGVYDKWYGEACVLQKLCECHVRSKSHRFSSYRRNSIPVGYQLVCQRYTSIHPSLA